MIWLIYLIGSILAIFILSREIKKRDYDIPGEDHPEYIIGYSAAFLGSWIIMVILMTLWLTKR